VVWRWRSSAVFCSVGVCGEREVCCGGVKCEVISLCECVCVPRMAWTLWWCCVVLCCVVLWWAVVGAAMPGRHSRRVTESSGPLFKRPDESIIRAA